MAEVIPEALLLLAAGFLHSQAGIARLTVAVTFGAGGYFAACNLRVSVISRQIVVQRRQRGTEHNSHCSANWMNLNCDLYG